MAKYRAKLLEVLLRKEKFRHFSKWLFLVSSGGWAIGSYKIFKTYFDGVDKLFLNTGPIEKTMIMTSQTVFTVGLLFFGMSMFFFILAIHAWIGSPERQAVIELLKEETVAS